MHLCNALQGVLKYGMILMSLYWLRSSFISRTSIEVIPHSTFPVANEKARCTIEHARTSCYPIQENLRGLSPPLGRGSHPGNIDITGPDRGSPPRHRRLRKTAPTRGELSPSPLRGSAGGRECPATVHL